MITLEPMPYREVDIGRAAVIYFPAEKMEQYADERRRWVEIVQEFFFQQYFGWTNTGIVFGCWRQGDGKDVRGYFARYEVSFEGKDRIPVLKGILSRLCFEMHEECLYLMTGEDSMLIYPESE